MEWKSFSPKLYIVVLLMFMSFQNVAQTSGLAEEKHRKWFVGGDFGLGISTYNTNVSLSPQIGYRIFPSFEAGVRTTYSYNGYKVYNQKFASHHYGGGIYLAYEIYKGFFAQAENEVLSYQQYYPKNNRVTIHSIFMGGGYRQYMSARSFSSILVLFNLNEGLETPYSNPLIRVGFGFGL